MNTTSSTVGTGPAIPDFPTISDAQIRAAITAAIETGNLAEDFGGFEDWGFESAIGDVAHALRDADLFGDYIVYAILDHDAGEGTTSGGQVLVKVPGGPTLAGHANELRHWMFDRTKTGIDGYVSIAEVIIGDAAHAVTALRNWAAGTTR